MKVTKFGGTSLATAANIRRAASIVSSDTARRFVVVSAAGRRFRGDIKVTDLLIERFGNLADELGVSDLRDFFVSRGEDFMARLFSRVIGFTYLDAADFVVIKRGGLANIAATKRNFDRYFQTHSREGGVVMGGFYGRTTGGQIRTFPRGGGDYSGAVAAVCLAAEKYEVFTDTYGVMTADPNRDPTAVTIPELTFAELFKICDAGAEVVFRDCVPLLARHKISLLVDNTFDPGKHFTNVN
jgi:aspartate kinase